ncbi:helix-turn-helix domain-containing protein [Methylovirgula sp. HY1]|uniref:helix-turn-helix domain-containing protein n=1 Tax=Methylovirgula sp. HY1 TaxID=2822761 RepID=UPI001C5ACBA8|nr:AraC family transcriptional regulator [Methylovirgula sp. HY1]QXX76572.1 Multiple antibiotic resistance protein MarA [Methylovirgula sp. HY1]
MTDMLFRTIGDHEELGTDTSKSMIDTPAICDISSEVVDATHWVRQALMDLCHLPSLRFNEEAAFPSAALEDRSTSIAYFRPSKGLDPRRLQRVLDFIDDHLEDNITIGTLAETACLSPFHFARAFKATAGMPPHQYVSARRVQFAKMLLAKGEQRLVDIALACGFSSQANFSRAFRQATSMAPGQFRAASAAAASAYLAPRRLTR